MNQAIKPQPEGHQDPDNWKFGIFYFNKADHRIFPPKRITQLGWTLNFAHWQAWLVLFGIFLIPLVLSSIIRH